MLGATGRPSVLTWAIKEMPMDLVVVLLVLILGVLIG